MKHLIIITDCKDVALNEIRGAIYSNAETDDFIIEPVVAVESYNVVNAAFLLRLLADIYPEGSVFCIIMNPLKLRTERIIGKTIKKNLIFEGTNTGVFYWLIKDFGCKELYELHDPGFIQFGGKYVHAPAVGKSLTQNLEKLGHKFDVSNIRKCNIEIGTVLHIDNFGNIKLYGKLENAQNDDKYFLKYKDQKYTLKYKTRMMDGNDGDLVIYDGSSFGFMEIGIVRGNAAVYLNIGIGEHLEVQKVG